MQYIDVKDKLDIGIALFGLLITLPLLIIIGIVIKLDSPGPIFYKQKRLGLHGKVFYIYKFRSMYLGSEKKGVYEIKGDQRVTRVGRIIRRTSLDEIPQFINILRGEMSLIGPRPPLTYHPWAYDKYTKKQKIMFEVKPGITGLAQINGRKEVEWNRRIEMNVEYVNRISLILDLKILIKTMIKVFMKEGIYNTRKTVNKELNK